MWTFNAYQTLAEANQTGISGLFVYVADIVPIFIPMMLFVIGTVILLASYFSQKRLTGYGNFWGSFAVSTWIVAVLTIILSIISNLVNFLTLSVTIVLAIVGVLMIIFNKDS